MIILFFNLSIRSTGKPVLLDSTKEKEMRSKLEERFQQYYEFREKVLSLREEDRVARNAAKEKQIQQYEEMQVCLSLFSYLFSLFSTIDDIAFKKNLIHSGWWGLQRDSDNNA